MEKEPNFLTMSDREWSVRAANRAGAAISMAQILKDELCDANERIKNLERQNAAFNTVLNQVLDDIDDLLNRGCSPPKTSN